jgi:hypothetical protein
MARRTTLTATIVAALLFLGAVPLAAALPSHRRAGPSTPNQQPTREWKRPPKDNGPPLPAGSGAGRRIVYSVTQQRVWLVDNQPADHIEKSYLVSGRAGTPSVGTYRVYSKSRYSSSGSLRLEYMVRFAHGRTLAIGFHSIPKRPDGSLVQSEAELGQYRSSGCVRQRLSDAAYLWNFAPIGTVVVVTR